MWRVIGRCEKMVEKVVSFITRKVNNSVEIVLFRHPSNDIQLPAGTVEDGEHHYHAAIREAQEETGLNLFKDIKLLGYEDIDIINDEFMIDKKTKVYSRPDANSLDWVEIRKGIYVSHLQSKYGYHQIEYKEYDDINDPKYISYHIIGWVPSDALTKKVKRYFYRLHFEGEGPATWEWNTDNHLVELFWVPVDNMPIINSYQQKWLKYMINDL